jgi:ribonuclease P protein component
VKRKFRLTRSNDFERVRRNGKSYAHPLLVLVAAPNQMDFSRIGVVAGKSVGSAVHRNRAKRLIRAAYQEVSTRIQAGWDLIFFARKPLHQANYDATWIAIRDVLVKARIFEENGGLIGRSVSE